MLLQTPYLEACYIMTVLIRRVVSKDWVKTVLFHFLPYIIVETGYVTGHRQITRRLLPVLRFFGDYPAMGISPLPLEYHVLVSFVKYRSNKELFPEFVRLVYNSGHRRRSRRSVTEVVCGKSSLWQR